VRALIVGRDGFQSRNILAAARGLGAAGWQVGIGSPELGLAANSKWVSRWHRVPLPTSDYEGFITGVNRAIGAVGYEVVFAGGDAEVLGLSAGIERIEARVPYPAPEETTRALDKLWLTGIAEEAGIRAPKTAPATPEAIASTHLPIIVKARLHWQPGSQGVPDRVEASLCWDRASAKAAVRRIARAGGKAVLQEVIEGRHTAYVALVDDRHRVIVAHQQDGYGTWPVKVGVWTRAQTRALDTSLDERCRLLLRLLRWRGLVQLQFLVPADGEPRLIDLNGRFYASVGMAVAAGSNLPAYWASVATGRNLSEVRSASPGFRYQWLEGDLLRAVQERRGGLLPDVMETLRYGRGAVPSLWRHDDTRPALTWLRQAVQRAYGRTFTAVSNRRRNSSSRS
jgi:predicted ATP-grasp superfamily ATP-dependent carboligase